MTLSDNTIIQTKPYKKGLIDAKGNLYNVMSNGYAFRGYAIYSIKNNELHEISLSDRIKELQEEAKEKGFRLDFAQPLIDSNHLSSTWYSGEIATLEYGNKVISFVCTEKVRLAIMDKVTNLPKHFFVDTNGVGTYYCPDFCKLFKDDAEIIQKESTKELVWTSRSIVRPEFKTPNGETVDYKKSTVRTNGKKKISLNEFLFYDENILDIFKDVEKFLPLFEGETDIKFVTKKGRPRNDI